MWPIMKRTADAERFSRQLDLREISCLGGHLRAPSGEEICGTYVTAAAPAVDAADQPRRQRDPAAFPAQRSGRSGQWCAPARWVQLACRSSAGAVGVLGVTGSPLKLWRALCRGDGGGHVLLTVRGVFAVKPLWGPGGGLVRG